MCLTCFRVPERCVCRMRTFSPIQDVNTGCTGEDMGEARKVRSFRASRVFCVQLLRQMSFSRVNFSRASIS